MAVAPVVRNTEVVPPSVRMRDSRFFAVTVISPKPAPTAFTTRVNVRLEPAVSAIAAASARATRPEPLTAATVTVPSANASVGGRSIVTRVSDSARAALTVIFNAAVCPTPGTFESLAPTAMQLAASPVE